MMNYNHLYYFHVIANEGSLKKAAEKLGISQSTLSEQLKSLETYFNMRLFDRKASGLKLNDRGRQVMRFTNVIFGAGGRLIQLFNKDSDTPRQTLEIGIGASVARTIAIEPFLPLFEREDVHVKVRTGSFDDLITKLISHELDLFVSDGQPNVKVHRGVKSVTMQRPQHFLVCSQKHKEMAAAVPTGEEGAKLPFIHYTPEAAMRWEVEQYLQQHQIIPDILGECDDVMLMKAAVEKGLGFALLPEATIRESLDAGTLVQASNLPPLMTKVYANFNEVETLELVKDVITQLSERGLGEEEEEHEEAHEEEHVENPDYHIPHRPEEEEHRMAQ